MSKPQNAKELRAFLTGDSDKLDPEKVTKFNSLCESGRLGLSNFSIKDLAENFMGQKDWANELPKVALRESRDIMESGGLPVTSTLFPQITGQLLFSEVREQFDTEANVFTGEVPVIQSSIRGTEIVPSITNIDPDDIRDIGEGAAYPSIGVSEEYHTLPAKQKDGALIKITREAIAFDKTGMLVQQAQKLGAAHGCARENEIIDCFAGIVNNFSRNGTSANTYQLSSVINNQSSTPLSDWTDLEGAMLLADGLLDPNTSEPLMHSFKHLIVMRAKLMTANRILTATSTRHSSDQAEPLDEATYGHNPVAGLGLKVLTSTRLRRRVIDSGETAAVADGTYWVGDLSKLLAYYEVWPLALLQKGMESEESWSNDISLQFKSTLFGVCAVREPRFMIRSEDTAWA